MRTTTVTGAVLVGAGVVLARRLRQRSQDSGSNRWRAVTIDRTADQVMPGGRVPEPLAALGDLVEVQMQPAPGDKGTELRVRLRGRDPGHSADARRVRSALREAKQLIEVGEVLRVDPAPHGARPPTPGGLLVEAAARRSGGEGLL